jgi:acid phosphatase family membrane protein YuiD
MRLLLSTATASTGGLVGLFHNGAFVAAFLGFFFAQSAKVFTHYYTERKWDFTRLVSSGGMPSSHTGLVSGVLLALA